MHVLRRPTLLIGAAWLVSRVALGWITAHDDAGPYRDTTPAANDIVIYDFWADQVGTGARPYVDFALEYPPANLPFLVGPQIGSSFTGRSYETAFLAMAIAIDGLALAGLVVLTKRGGSWAGPLAWLAFVPLLGPVALSRLDVIPAAALVWAVVLARERRWIGAGAALGVATGTKVFAGALLPIWIALEPARRRVTGLVVGFVVAGAIPLLAFVDVPGALIDNVWEYHSGRGVAAESTWGSLLLAGEHLSGRTATIELRSGAWEIVNANTGMLKTAATVAVISVVVHATVIARRRSSGPALADLVTLSASTVVLSVGLGNIFSAQYLIWCIAAVCAAAAAGARIVVPLSVIGVATGVTHLLFPIYFVDTLFDQHAPAIALLVARNLLVLGAGYLLLQQAIRDRNSDTVQHSDPGVEEHEPLPVTAGDW